MSVDQDIKSFGEEAYIGFALRGLERRGHWNTTFID